LDGDDPSIPSPNLPEAGVLAYLLRTLILVESLATICVSTLRRSGKEKYEGRNFFLLFDKCLAPAEVILITHSPRPQLVLGRFIATGHL